MSQSNAGAQPKIGLVSLGCPKALVDSERIMSTLRAQGYAFSRDYAGADVVIVNGCLGVEEDLIRQTHPNVLAVTGPHQYEAVVSAVNAHLPPVPNAFV